MAPYVKYSKSNYTNLSVQNGKILSLLAAKDKYKTIMDAEFKIFSQWGEDGIIQYLVNSIPIKNKSFVEFGVENYDESNTKFLLLNNNWSGLVIDSEKKNIHYITSQEYYWRQDIRAICEFVNSENINQILLSNDISGEIGILSIDIDGIDYWVWKAITVIEPDIVVIEYNSIFGEEKSVTVPNIQGFSRINEHFSGLYWGASLPALVNLGIEKGYIFIGCNSAGNNAFFVRNRYKISIDPIEVNKAFVDSKFREARDESGKLYLENKRKYLALIQEKKVFDLITDKETKIGDLYGRTN